MGGAVRETRWGDGEGDVLGGAPRETQREARWEGSGETQTFDSGGVRGPHTRREAWIYLAAVLSCARANTHNTQHTAHGPSPFDPVLTRMREKRPSAPPPSSPSVRSVGQAVESERALPVLAEAILDAGRVGTLECRSRMRLGEGLGCWDQANLRSVLMRAGWDRGRGVWGRVCTPSLGFKTRFGLRAALGVRDDAQGRAGPGRLPPWGDWFGGHRWAASVGSVSLRD